MTAGNGLGAAALQIRAHAERIAAVETTLAGMSTALTALRGTVTDQGQVLASLDGLAAQAAQLTAQVAQLAAQDGAGTGYQPAPAVQWWAASSAERDAAAARLRDWVTQIYRPYYGHLAAAVRDCWEDHPLCLVQLDWVSELWSVLYLQPGRNARDLAAQAEFGARILPAVSEQLACETSRCAHRRASAAAGSWAGAR